MTNLTTDLYALSFQAVLTALLAVASFGLWRRQRGAYFLSWAAAWMIYALRLVAISAYLENRNDVWLFVHQAATLLVALLLLCAALQFSRGFQWRWRYAWLGVAVVAWAAISIFLIHDLRAAGITSAVLLSAVTLWTSLVFARHRQRVPSGGATVLAWTFLLWGLHHLDYPLLRALGHGVLFGVFADVLLIVAASLGTLFLVLGDERRAMAVRNAQLEQMTRQLLRAQEDERRRISRELHDQAGQVLTAIKIELDLEGRREASELVGKALAEIRDLSHLLRPTDLDDLGLLPALRELVEDFSRRTRTQAALDVREPLARLGNEIEVMIYRVVQEALTNVARHAQAEHVYVALEAESGEVRLAVQDDGRGVAGNPVPHLGLLGMRERVTDLGGIISFDSQPQGGFRIQVRVPAGNPA
jgi:signal transduction histidine kinase